MPNDDDTGTELNRASCSLCSWLGKEHVAHKPAWDELLDHENGKEHQRRYREIVDVQGTVGIAFGSEATPEIRAAGAEATPELGAAAPPAASPSEQAGSGGAIPPPDAEPEPERPADLRKLAIPRRLRVAAAAWVAAVVLLIVAGACARTTVTVAPEPAVTVAPEPAVALDVQRDVSPVATRDTSTPIATPAAIATATPAAAALATTTPVPSVKLGPPTAASMATFYGFASPGDVIEAFIGGVSCGTDTGDSATVSSGFWIVHIAEGEACSPSLGDSVSFTLNRAATNETATWTPDAVRALSYAISLSTSAAVAAPAPTATPTPPPWLGRLVEVVGTAEFVADTNGALALLDLYAWDTGRMVGLYLTKISLEVDTPSRPGEYVFFWYDADGVSGRNPVEAWEAMGTSRTWYAGAIVHVACHVDHRARGLDYGGRTTELACGRQQVETMRMLGGDAEADSLAVYLDRVEDGSVSPWWDTDIWGD